MANSGRAKFVIQPFKHNQQMDEEYANKTWQTLHNAIHEIHKQNASGLSFEELYRNAYNMVLHKFGDKLYQGLTDTITAHLRTVAEQVQAANDTEFLTELKDKWDKHKVSSIMIRDILMYMVRRTRALRHGRRRRGVLYALLSPLRLCFSATGPHVRGRAEEGPRVRARAAHLPRRGRAQPSRQGPAAGDAARLGGARGAALPALSSTRLLMVPQLTRARRSPGSVAARWSRAA